MCVCLGTPEIYSRVHANRLQKKTWNIGTAPSLCSTFSTRKLRFIPLVLYGCHISGQTCCFTQVTSSLIIIVILFYWSLVGDKKKATKSTRFYKVVPKSPFSPSPFCFLFKCRSRRPRKVATQFFRPSATCAWFRHVGFGIVPPKLAINYSPLSKTEAETRYAVFFKQISPWRDFSMAEVTPKLQSHSVPMQFYHQKRSYIVKISFVLLWVASKNESILVSTLYHITNPSDTYN